MSHWSDVKCELKCSVDIMRRAIINIMPEWEKYMHVSKDGTLAIKNSYMSQWGTGSESDEQQRGGEYHIVIPGGGNTSMGEPCPDLRYADMGLRKNGDGTWTITADPSGHPYMRNIQGRIQAQVEQMRAKAQAQMSGNKILFTETEEDGTTITDIQINIDENGFMA